MAGDALKYLISPLGAAVGLFGKSKPKPAAAPTPVVTRDEAAEEAERRDTVARRRGVGANMILGARGAESSTGGKTSLGA